MVRNATQRNATRKGYVVLHMSSHIGRSLAASQQGSWQPGGLFVCQSAADAVPLWPLLTHHGGYCGCCGCCLLVCRHGRKIFVVIFALLGNFWLYCVIWMAIVPHYFDYKTDPTTGKLTYIAHTHCTTRTRTRKCKCNFRPPVTHGISYALLTRTFLCRMPVIYYGHLTCVYQGQSSARRLWVKCSAR